ncbi:hypothetical protein H6P81_012657 [Aristolochia fimbriata]|uniref:DNA topoisomerase n=1 Tax=Aristolochia fimbriata TaxID=158543 RepID=A0AAV7EE04_ARIFI|nr:hypothetical protein H6P81_012657 [Aristolochia fimbriata]
MSGGRRRTVLNVAEKPSVSKSYEEGENIAFEVIEVCTGANPRLEIYRAHFSALTDRDILASVQKLLKPNQLDADAVDARQIMLLRDAFVLDNALEDRNIILSYGPCQILVVKVSNQERRKYPPFPLSTVELQKRASRYFHMSSEHTMKKEYLEVYRFESWGSSIIPNYALGQKFIPASLTLDSSITRLPSLLSESYLLSCMDKAGIGTDATMDDHIKKLLDRFYATKYQNTRFSPTNLGQVLVMGYDVMGYFVFTNYFAYY